MGFDIQMFKILKHTYDKYGKFGETLTIGRQGLHTPARVVEMILNVSGVQQTEFADDVLKNFLGSTTVDSLDFSDYEGASIIMNMGKPIEDSFSRKFDTIIDGGCLEHIYEITTALRNVSKLCKVGGTIIHVLPTNNQCGHGFYQFSPELFFSLYSEKNGYADTEVFLGDTTDPNWTYQILPPKEGERNDINHPNPLYVMVRTKLTRENFSHEEVQQSEYSYIWEKSKHE